MTNKTTNKPPFKVKCIDASFNNGLTEGKEYEVKHIAYEWDTEYYQVCDDNSVLKFCCSKRFEIVETPPKDKQEFSVGDKVMINKISIDYAPSIDKNVKVGNVATVENIVGSDVKLSNPNWERGWWFSKADVSLVGCDKSQDCRPLSPQEVVQAVIDGKELEMQYKTGKWGNVIPMKTTLHQLANLNFRLKPETPLEDKRKVVIKKLLENKVAVLCKCWDDDERWTTIEAITSISDDYTHPYMTNCLAYKNAYAIHDNGDEITNVE